MLRCIHIADFVWPTVKTPKDFNLESQKTRNVAKHLIWEAAYSECLTFLLVNWPKKLIDY